MIINQSAKTQALSYLVGSDTTVEALTLRLFSNNATITDSTVVASVTEVTTGDGYTPKVLTGSSWTVSAGPPPSAVSTANLDVHGTKRKYLWLLCN